MIHIFGAPCSSKASVYCDGWWIPYVSSCWPSHYHVCFFFYKMHFLSEIEYMVLSNIIRNFVISHDSECCWLKRYVTRSLDYVLPCYPRKWFLIISKKSFFFRQFVYICLKRTDIFRRTSKKSERNIKESGRNPKQISKIEMFMIKSSWHKSLWPKLLMFVS